MWSGHGARSNKESCSSLISPFDCCSTAACFASSTLAASASAAVERFLLEDKFKLSEADPAHASVYCLVQLWE